jgi:hypothetical protein
MNRSTVYASKPKRRSLSCLSLERRPGQEDGVSPESVSCARAAPEPAHLKAAAAFSSVFLVPTLCPAQCPSTHFAHLAMESTSWSPPLYAVAEPPRLLATRTLVGDGSFPHNFARSARWCVSRLDFVLTGSELPVSGDCRCPDGSVALAHCEDRSFQFVDLCVCLASRSSLVLIWRTGPRNSSRQARTPPVRRYLHGAHKEVSCMRAAQLVRPLRTLRQAGAILDFAWYPAASAYNPAAFCFAASVRDCPVKLLDGSDGRVSAHAPSRLSLCTNGRRACSSARRTRSSTTASGRSRHTASCSPRRRTSTHLVLSSRPARVLTVCAAGSTAASRTRSSSSICTGPAKARACTRRRPKRRRRG